LAVQDLRAIVAGWLRTAMATEGISAEDLAARARLAKSTVYRLLAEEVQPEESTIKALGRALKTPFPRLAPDGESPIKSDAVGSAGALGERPTGRGHLVREPISAQYGQDELDWIARTSRQLFGPDSVGIPLPVQLKFLEKAEEIGVERHGPQIHAHAVLMRQELLGRHGGSSSGAPPRD